MPETSIDARLDMQIPNAPACSRGSLVKFRTGGNKKVENQISLSHHKDDDDTTVQCHEEPAERMKNHKILFRNRIFPPSLF